MGPAHPLLISMGEAADHPEAVVGGKAAKLMQLARAGYRVPQGFCLTTWAYRAFVDAARVDRLVRIELGRKPLSDMRWEELWDAALRIRAIFLSHPLPEDLQAVLGDGLRMLGERTTLAVRSSAVGEDAVGSSFAGLHESVLGVRGLRALEDAVRVVWASLWSDAALLYRKELGLDPGHSRMAVLVQETIVADRSGVAFGRDPRNFQLDHAIIESVPGPCHLLVDGVVEPDRWEMSRETGAVVRWSAGERAAAEEEGPLLESRDLARVLDTVLSIEDLLAWAPDMEWTGRHDDFTVLQARPITTEDRGPDTQRRWYLSLRPGAARLQALRKRVVSVLIPELTEEGATLAAEALDVIDDEELAEALVRRRETVERWKKIYWEEFIPFAHGVRHLATYYNDAVRPKDPYEFVGLLQGQPLMATQRNHAIEELARQLASNKALRRAVERSLDRHGELLTWADMQVELEASSCGAEGFVEAFEFLRERFLDIAHQQERLYDHPEPLLRNMLELAGGPGHPAPATPKDDRVALLEKGFLDAVGPDRRTEALDVLETGRVSWKLRDDDNLLVARLESQFLRALHEAGERLRSRGQLRGQDTLGVSVLNEVVCALRDPSRPPVVVEPPVKEVAADRGGLEPGESPRQLIGQPASPGVATGTVRCIRGHDDLGAFCRGEVLVCDAIQPTMTHLVPLAGAIVERRGGMLIHGAIVARELGIPCVNGVRNAAEVLNTGDLVTVDGHLGIVAVGSPDFDLEFEPGSHGD